MDFEEHHEDGHGGQGGGSREEREQAAGPRRRGLCLVIEDDHDSAGLLSLILANAGFDVHRVNTGAGGLLAARDLTPALITLDVGLPDADDRDIAQDLRKASAAPIIIITANAGPRPNWKAWPPERPPTSTNPSTPPSCGRSSTASALSPGRNPSSPCPTEHGPVPDT